MLVISCHADTGFRAHSLARRPDGTLHGHLDNFAGVHAVMRAYFSGRMTPGWTRIELTYGEEVDLAGAYEVRATLLPTDVVLVVDVTGAGADVEFTIEKCADPGLRGFLEKTLAGMRYSLHEGCPDPISSFDESDVYSELCPRTCFLGIPCLGGDYNAGPVTCREESLIAAAEAICRVAERFGEIGG